MSSADTPQPDSAALARQLKQSLQRSRFRRQRIVLLCALVVAGLLGAMAWSVYYPSGDIAVSVIALTSVGNTSEVGLARAVLVAPDVDGGASRRGGYEVIFLDPAPPPGAMPRRAQAVTDRAGYAQVSWPMPDKSPVATFRARHIDPRQRRGSEGDGRIYRWPREAAILLIEVEGLLADPPPEARPLAPVQAAAPGGALEALSSLPPEVQVVYLLPATEGWLPARRLRAWVEERFGDGTGLPAGPVLGKLDFPTARTGADIRPAAVALLRERFTGQLAALVQRADAVSAYRDKNVPVLWFGEAAPPLEVPRAAAWSDVPAMVRRALAKKS
jgi:hypothetical protein